MNKRRYSVFVKKDGRWVRLSPYAYTLESARQVWQGVLLNGSLTGRQMALRPAQSLPFEECATWETPEF